MKLVIALLITFSLFADTLNDGYNAYSQGDYETSEKIFHELCDKNNSEACHNLGIQLTEHKKLEKAVTVFNKGCILNNKASCFKLASLVFDDDINRAEQAFAKSCELGFASACNVTGLIHLNGDGNIPRSKEIAKLYFTKGCNKADEKSCKNLKLLTTKKKNCHEYTDEYLMSADSLGIRVTKPCRCYKATTEYLMAMDYLATPAYNACGCYTVPTSVQMSMDSLGIRGVKLCK